MEETKTGKVHFCKASYIIKEHYVGKKTERTMEITLNFNGDHSFDNVVVKTPPCDPPTMTEHVFDSAVAGTGGITVLPQAKTKEKRCHKIRKQCGYISPKTGAQCEAKFLDWE
jgi:hypothetical protein